MYSNLLNAALTVLFFLQLDNCGVSAQTVQSIIWNTPNGNLRDLTQTFTAGTTLALSWNKWNSTSYVDTTTNLVNLWVTTFDPNAEFWSKSVRTNINLRQAGSFAWTIDIPDSQLALSAKYVLRFKLPSVLFDSSKGELSSPGFLVLRPVADTSTSSSRPSSSSSSSSSSSRPSSTNSASTSSTTASSGSASSVLSTLSSTPGFAIQATGPLNSPSNTQAAELNPSTEPSPGLNTGTKAGIGIGAAVGALAFIAAIVFFILRKRNNPDNQEGKVSNAYVEPHQANELGTDKAVLPQYHAAPVAPAELPPGNAMGATELPTHRY